MGTTLLRSRAACCADVELRPLPSRGITLLRRYYEPLHHLILPKLTPAARMSTVTRHHCGASSIFICLFLHAGRRQNSGGTSGTCRSLIGVSVAATFRVTQACRLTRHPFCGLLGIYTLTACLFAESLSRIFFSRTLPVGGSRQCG